MKRGLTADLVLQSDKALADLMDEILKALGHHKKIDKTDRSAPPVSVIQVRCRSYLMVEKRDRR